MDYFQFSWRFLSLEIIIASFLAGSLVNFIRYKPILILLCVISILLVKDYNKVPYYLERPDSYYLTRSNFIDGTNSPGNYFNTVWSKKRKEREKEKLKILSGDVKILSSKISSNKYDFKIDTKNEAKFLVNVNYFPGWTVYVDNVNINITQEKGQISFIIPKNSKQINIQFLDTPTRKIATYVFFITLVYALYLISYEKIHKKHII